MSRIPDELIERVKVQASVVTLAERAGVELRRTGGEMVGRCPFPPHEDSTPSLSINIARNVWQCFGCGIGGSAIDWVMHARRCEFREAVEVLLREFFPEEAAKVLAEPGRPQTRRSRAPELPCPFDFSASDAEIYRQYVDYCHALYHEWPEPQAYARKRGLDDPELVTHFKLGYQDRSLGLRIPTNETKAGREVRTRLQDLGLIRKSGHGSFVGSLIIPTIDLEGAVTGIYARKTRDDLNAKSSPKHLYLSGPDTDVFNEEAFLGSKEIILCEARIDAVAGFWRHGFRNVTACRGAGNLSPALLEAFTRHGVTRCSIAFDRDEAGDEGAVKAAGKLQARGVECYRVLFPRGMDACEVALKMTPARKHLDLFLRSAEWMGNGRPKGASVAVQAPPRHDLARARPEEAALKTSRVAEAPEAPEAAPETEAGRAAARPVEATEEGEPGRAAEEGSLVASPEALATPPAPPSPATSDPLVSSTDDEAVFLFGDRRYRVRGLKRNTAFGILKLNVLTTREGVSFEGTPLAGLHADTFDLYLARARQLFERQAAEETGVKDDVVKRDLCAMLRRLEEIQTEALKKAHEPKVKAIPLTEKETKEALDFWKSQDLLGRIVSDMTACGLVGEATNKLVTFIAACSRLLERPLAVIIQSSSAAGKTALMEAILSLMPEECREKYTAVSGKSLFYFDEGTSLRHKILAIVEEEGAERATYPLKLLQSEGELVMASTGKDPHTGKLVTQVYRVEGPVMIILTTTAIELDPELENRCLRLTVDESREQTRLIHELQRSRQTLEGLYAGKEKERIQRLHRNAQRLLRRVKVLNPYVKELTFVDDQTRTRRDHEKYLTLIETIALMHQHQRPLERVVVEGEVVECVKVELADIAVANRLAGEVLGRTLDELPPQSRRFLELLHRKVGAVCEEQGVERCDLRFTRRDVREWTGYRATQVFVHMARLEELEYVLRHRGGRGQSFVYELLYRGEGVDGRPFVLGLVDVEALGEKERECAKAEEVAKAGGAPGPAGDAAAPVDEADPAVPTYDPNLSGFSEGVSGPNRGQIGGVSAGSRTPATGPQPARDAAFSDSGEQSRENALIPAAGNPRSYKTRSYHLKPFRRGLRVNLLRFPPGSLGRSARGAASNPAA